MGIITKGSNFGKAIQYDFGLLSGQEKEVTYMFSRGLIIQKDLSTSLPDIDLIERCFLRQAKLNRRVQYPVKHIALSWPEEDSKRLTDNMMKEIAIEYLEKMNWANTQIIITRHSEKNNQHCHILVNAVDNQGKKLWDFQEQRRNQKVCKDITQKMGFTWGRHKCYHQCAIPKDCSKRLKEKVRYDIAKSVLLAISQVESLNELPRQLMINKSHVTAKIKYDQQQHPIDVQFSKSDKDRKGNVVIYKFSSAQLDKRLSLANMCKLIHARNEIPDALTQADEIEAIYRSNEYQLDEEMKLKSQELCNLLENIKCERKRILAEAPADAPNAYVFTALALLYGQALLSLVKQLAETLLVAVNNGRISKLLNTDIEAKNQNNQIKR